MNKLIYKVKEVRETYDIYEVNELVEKNWILLKIVPKKDKLMFSIGKLNNYD